MKLSPNFHLAMAKLLRKKAAKLVPSLAKPYRQRANTALAMAKLAGRDRHRSSVEDKSDPTLNPRE